MLRRDYESAAANLETAHREAPNHRGIIKNLGSAYVWLGELDKAQALLGRIPEAQSEMRVYIWWWETQGRPDLSENASMMASLLNTSPLQSTVDFRPFARADRGPGFSGMGMEGTSTSH
jgi:hypothetical protein